MVLVDTSVWVSHLRYGNAEMEILLNEGIVVCHNFVIGELACGNLKNRTEILTLFQSLPLIEIVEQEEVLQFIENYQLMGKGLGFIDIHLLTSALLSDIPLWTLDKKLNQTASKINLSYKL